MCYLFQPFFLGYFQSKSFIDGSSEYTINGCFKELGGSLDGVVPQNVAVYCLVKLSICQFILFIFHT